MPNVDNRSAFFTQQLFLIGTYNEDGSANFAPISWISFTWGPPKCLVISMFGAKRTTENIARAGKLSATVVTPDMLTLVEELGGPQVESKERLIAELGFKIESGYTMHVPLISDAKYSFECEVVNTVELGDSHTYFAETKRINASEDILNLEYWDLNEINPVVYSPGNYYAVGKHLGKIGDYACPRK